MKTQEELKLKELLEEKRKIEEQIKELRDTGVYTKSKKAFLYRRKNYWNEKDENDTTAWAIGIMSKNIDTDRISQKRPLISGYNKKEVIAALPEVISELQELLCILTEKKEKDDE